MYLPTEGKIEIGEKNILDMSTEEYFRMFSVVFQETKWMPISILENITMKEAIYSDEQKAWKVLEKIGLSEKVKELPEGIYTPLITNLNKEAVQLSGGELQKLCMARALYKNGDIIILDEPTAALDPIAESELYLTFNDLIKGKTAIFISHRLASTRFCDRIIFLENGIITESGTHNELMKKSGCYSKLYKVQSQYYEEE